MYGKVKALQLKTKQAAASMIKDALMLARILQECLVIAADSTGDGVYDSHFPMSIDQRCKSCIPYQMRLR